MTAAFYAALNDIPMNCYTIDMKEPGAFTALGMFGALVSCWQQADSFWEHLLSNFQGIFWLPL